MPFTPFNWYIWVFLLLLCQSSHGTTCFLKTFSGPLNLNPCVDADKWWPLLPWSPIQSNTTHCPETPEAYLRFAFNSLWYCISFHLQLLDRNFCLLEWLFFLLKIVLVPLVWLGYSTLRTHSKGALVAGKQGTELHLWLPKGRIIPTSCLPHPPCALNRCHAVNLMGIHILLAWERNHGLWTETTTVG